jgi:hypothetical protein
LVTWSEPTDLGDATKTKAWHWSSAWLICLT